MSSIIQSWGKFDDKVTPFECHSERWVKREEIFPFNYIKMETMHGIMPTHEQLDRVWFTAVIVVDFDEILMNLHNACNVIYFSWVTVREEIPCSLLSGGFCQSYHTNPIRFPRLFAFFEFWLVNFADRKPLPSKPGVKVTDQIELKREVPQPT